MKVKIVLLMLAVVLSKGSHAQTLLTNKEVYNFQVGEAVKYTKVTTEYSDVQPFEFTAIKVQKDSILSRNENPGNQTISYQVLRTDSNELGNVHDTVITITYPFNDNSVSCSFSFPSIPGSTLDTLVAMAHPGFIPATRLEMRYVNEINTVNKETIYFIKGLGGPYLLLKNDFGMGGGTAIWSYLDYSKNGEPPVRIYFTITQNLEKTGQPGFRPNPFASYVEVPESAIGSTYYITNLQGKLIDKGAIEGERLDLHRLNTGIYQLAITFPDGERKVQRIVKE